MHSRMRFHSVLLLAWLLGATGASANVVVNSVRPWTGNTGIGGNLPSSITLFNTGPVAQDLSGWEVRAAGDSAVAVPLPSWLLPSGCYLLVNLGPDSLDSDFSDSTGVYSPGIETGALVQEAGNAAIYDNGALMDFVAWGADSTVTDATYDDAVLAGQWTPSTWVDTSDLSTFDHLGRIPSGYDTDLPTDWQVQASSYAFPILAHNDIQLEPGDGSLHLSVDTLEWRDVPDATAYRVQVATDTLLTSLVVDTVVVGSTQLSGFTHADSTMHYWRVQPQLAGGPYPASIWRFLTLEASGGGSIQAVRAQLPVPQAAVPGQVQHKDTPLLCVWNLVGQLNQRRPLTRRLHRPGCDLTAVRNNGPWNAPHSALWAHVRRCGHCNMYCVRASFQMVNQSLGGSLSQDEISVNLLGATNAGPEGDLGHGMGGNAQNMLPTLRWVLNNNNGVTLVQLPNANGPAQVAADIAAGRPVVMGLTTRIGARVNTESHCVVVDGYFNFRGNHFYHISDPIPGGTAWYNLNRLRGDFYLRIPAGATGRAGSTSIFTNNAFVDTDNDGVLDYDEGMGRNFQSNVNMADTDADGIGDLQEIRSYTFHLLDHRKHPQSPMVGQHPRPDQRLSFADVDNDTNRAENDTDTDGDTLADANEDCNANGNSPEAMPNPACAPPRAETCVYDPTDPGAVGVTLQWIRVQTEANRVTLRWSVIDDGELAGFEVWRDGFLVATGDDVSIDNDKTYAWTDLDLQSGRSYHYRIDAIERAGERFVLTHADATPSARALPFAMHPAQPNPFNPATTITFDLPRASRVRLTLYDVAGRRVAIIVDEMTPAGRNQWRYAPEGLASGIYLLHLQAGRHAATQRLVLVK